MTKTVSSYLALITDPSALGQRIGAFKTTYTRSYLMAQQIAVCCLVLAAATGDPTHLNTFFSILKTNDKDAFRNFVRRVFSVIGGWDGKTTVPQEQMIEFKQAGEWLKITNGVFRVMRNDEGALVSAAKTAMQAEAFVNALLAPDGKTWKPFLDRNNFAETKTFGVEELQKNLATMIKRARGERKGVDASVPDGMLEALVAAQKVIGEPASASKSLVN